MNSQLQQIESALIENSNYYLKIGIENTSKYLKRPNVSENSHLASGISYSDIQTTGLSLTDYLTSQLEKHNSPLLIQTRVRKGKTTTLTVDSIPNYRFTGTQKTNTPMESYNAPQQSQNNHHNNNDLVAGQNAQVMHLSNLQTKANESDRNLKDFYQEKEKNLALIAENNKIIAENRDLLTFKAVSLERIEMAKEKAEQSKKSIVDSEAGKQFIASIPEFIAAFTSAKNGNSQMAEGQNAPLNLSKEKTILIQSISHPDTSDSIINLINRSAPGLTNNKEFTNEFYDLLEKHQL
jgi:hypothetical protein